MGVGVLNSVIIVRTLGAEGQGIIGLVVTSVTFLATCLGGGLQWSNVHYVGRYRDNFHTIFFNSLIFAVLIGFLIISLFFSVRHQILENYIAKPFLLPLLVSVPFLLMQQYNQAIMQGIEDFNSFNLINIFRVCTLASAYALFLLVFGVEVYGAVLCWMASTILVSGISIYMVLKKIGRPKIYINLRQFIASFRMGTRITLMMVLSILLFRLDIYLVKYFLESAAVGYYFIAVIGAEILLTAPVIAGQLIMPKASAQEETSHRLSAQLNRMSIIYSAVLGALLLLFGKFFIVILFGSDFIQTYHALILLLPGIMATNANSILSNYIGGKEGYPWIMFFSISVALIINVILNLLLIPRYGINGAAVATTIAYLVLALINSKYFIHITRLTVKETFIPNMHDMVNLNPINFKHWLRSKERF